MTDIDITGSSAVKSASKVLVFSCQIITSNLKLMGLNVLLFGCTLPGDLVGQIITFVTNTKNVF